MPDSLEEAIWKAHMGPRARYLMLALRHVSSPSARGICNLPINHIETLCRLLDQPASFVVRAMEKLLEKKFIVWVEEGSSFQFGIEALERRACH